MVSVLVYHEVGDFRRKRGVSAVDLQRHLELIASSGAEFAEPRGFDPGTVRQQKSMQFLLTFDDATEGHRSVAFEFLNRYNAHGLFFVPTEKIGKPHRLRQTEIIELSAAGHSLGVHGHTHDRWDHLDVMGLTRELSMSRSIIEEMSGEPPEHTAPPGGFTSHVVRQVVSNMGFATLRSMRWGLSCGDDAFAMSVLPMTHQFGDMFIRAALAGRGSSLIRATYAAKKAFRYFRP